MDHNLAKKLKDAGFPFDWERKCPFCTQEGTHHDCPDPIPTLSELMDVMQSRYKYIPGLINDAHFVLLKTFMNGNEKGYIACLEGDWESSEIESKYRFINSTPEEAVANLWLAINQK